MYAYSCARAGQSDEFWDSAELNPDTKEFVNNNVSCPK